MALFRSLSRQLSSHLTKPSFTTTGNSSFLSSVAATEPLQPRKKLKIPTKRAGHLLIQLNEEEVKKSVALKERFDSFLPGDAVEIEYLINKTSGSVHKSKGVVIARRNRGLGSAFTMRNHVGGTAYEQTIMIHSPLLKSIKVLKERYIHGGKKRVRRSKLYYLRDKAPKLTTV